MTDQPKENQCIDTSGDCVVNAEADCAAAADQAFIEGKGPPPDGKKSREGVGVSDRASNPGVAIYSGEAPEKKSNAYGVSENPTWSAPRKLIPVVDPRRRARICSGVGCEICEADREFAAKHKSSVCDSAQVSNSEARA